MVGSHWMLLHSKNHHLLKYYRQNDMQPPTYTDVEALDYVLEAGFETVEHYKTHIFPQYALQPLQQLESEAHFLNGPTEYQITVSDAMKRITPRHLLLPDDTWDNSFQPMIYLNMVPYEIKSNRDRKPESEDRRLAAKREHQAKVAAEKAARLARREVRERERRLNSRLRHQLQSGKDKILQLSRHTRR